MTYKELQQKAKELGLPYVGVSRTELKKSIENAQPQKGVDPSPTLKNKVPSEKPASPTDTPEVEQPNKRGAVSSLAEKEETKEPMPVQPEDKGKVNTAVVYNGSHEVRRYSLDVHGPKFADLALQFISDRKYTIKFIDVQASHVCPACGHKFDTK